MTDLIQVAGVSKTYASGFTALQAVDLNVRNGEILALLGPNGAGKTTLISIVCGIVRASGGKVTVGGFDIVEDYKKTRALIGLVPQELTTEAFETVWATVNFSRGLFGHAPDPAYLEKLLKALSLWEKRNSKIITLSGGMKRRVLIAKALAHEPRILFLDEPTAGVDVELRKDMWALVRKLRDDGVTVILTTHYIEEAEEIADRVAVINNGSIVIVDDKSELMRKLGKKQLILELHEPLNAIPVELSEYGLEIGDGGGSLIYTYDVTAERKGITALMADLGPAGIRYRDMVTRQSSLEDIFVDLVRGKP